MICSSRSFNDRFDELFELKLIVALSKFTKIGTSTYSDFLVEGGGNTEIYEFAVLQKVRCNQQLFLAILLNRVIPSALRIKQSQITGFAKLRSSNKTENHL